MSRKSAKPGSRASGVEVTNVSPRGFWLLAGGRERYVDFRQFPWFRDATIGALVNVKQPRIGHLRWPDLDVDLEMDSIDRPVLYPLVSRGAVARVGEGRPRRAAGRATSVPARPAKRGRARRASR